jgi:ketol-acid reductoisomerase
MSDTSKTPGETLVEIIKPDAVVNIKVSTGYYRRFQEAVMHLVEGKSKEELEKALEEIKSGKIQSDWVRQYETLLIFCKEFETTAKNEGMTEMISTKELQDRISSIDPISPSDSQSDEQ